MNRSLRVGWLVAASMLVAACAANEATDDAAEKPQAASTVTTLDETALIESLAAPIVYSDFGSRVIYFVMTDRYANGDPANDSGFLTGPRSVTGFDPTDIGFFHGGDLKGLTGTCAPGDNGLARIKKLGFTAVWVTPLVVQQKP
ncbi:MAG: hypothetical protein EBV42_06765, partial [Actinobacteria bacterium]|nr:hypothetical protein [Actinomycetota bacterium]